MRPFFEKMFTLKPKNWPILTLKSIFFWNFDHKTEIVTIFWENVYLKAKHLTNFDLEINFFLKFWLKNQFFLSFLPKNWKHFDLKTNILTDFDNYCDYDKIDKMFTLKPNIWPILTLNPMFFEILTLKSNFWQFFFWLKTGNILTWKPNFLSQNQNFLPRNWKHFDLESLKPKCWPILTLKS